MALPSLVRVEAMVETMAEPTTTPSANLAIACTCSADLTPKPTQIGKSVSSLMAATVWERREESGVAVPVMPVMET